MTEQQKRLAVFRAALELGCLQGASMRDMCQCIIDASVLPDTGLDIVTIANDVLALL